jgi:hypothetical protein
VHPVLSRSSSTAAPDVAAGFGSYDNSGGGAAWWQEWEPSASEARQQQQQQQQQQRQQQQQAPHRPRPWQPPADSDAQVLTTLTTQVASGHAWTDQDTLRHQLCKICAGLAKGALRLSMIWIIHGSNVLDMAVGSVAWLQVQLAGWR